jgi:hypothetical protein
VIVVATADFEVYHEVVTALQERSLAFTTVEPGDALPEGATAVITAPSDELGTAADVPVIRANPDEARRAIETASGALRDGEGRRVVGVDPGERPGIAVLDGETVVATFQVPTQRVGEIVTDEVADAADPLVRIGDGARLAGARIVDDLPEVPVELVDETGTTPYLGTGTRGVGDVLAAVNIALRSGERVDERAIEPTAGELTRIKARSREQSADNRTIDEALARRVATGELSIREALAEHREPGDAG